MSAKDVAPPAVMAYMPAMMPKEYQSVFMMPYAKIPPLPQPFNVSIKSFTVGLFRNSFLSTSSIVNGQRFLTFEHIAPLAHINALPKTVGYTAYKNPSSCHLTISIAITHAAPPGGWIDPVHIINAIDIATAIALVTTVAPKNFTKQIATNDANKVATITFHILNAGASFVPNAKTDIVPQAPMKKGCWKLTLIMVSTTPKISKVANANINPYNTSDIGRLSTSERWFPGNASRTWPSVAS